MINIPQHNYMTYKKQSSLGYFCQLRPNKSNNNNANPVYKTMKSFYVISKICGLLKADKNQPKRKIISIPKKLPDLSDYLTQSLPRSIQTRSNKSFLETSLDIFPQHKRKTNSVNFERTFTQISDIKSKVNRFQINLKNNKQQIKVINRYNKLLDKFYDKIPSPTQSVTRQSIKENQQFQKLCKQDIFLSMNRQNKKAKRQNLQNYQQPQLPDHIKQRLVTQNKLSLQIQRKQKDNKKTNKILIKKRFLSTYKDGKYIKLLQERSKSHIIRNSHQN